MSRGTLHSDPFKLILKHKLFWSFYNSANKLPKAFIQVFLLGAVSATFAKVIIAPIERIKLLLQLQRELVISGKLNTPYTGLCDCVFRVITEQGVSSLWFGNKCNIIRYFPTQVLGLIIPKDLFKKMFTADFKKEYWKWFLFNVISGTLSSALSLLFVYPLDVARTVLTTNPQDYTGIVDFLLKRLQRDGIVIGLLEGWYGGFWCSVLGTAFYRGVYFGLYEILKKVLSYYHPSGKRDNFWTSFFLGWVSTLGAGILSYPLDTIRRCIMMRDGHERYMGSWDCAIQIMKQDGVLGFFRGSACSTLSVIVGAASFCFCDAVIEPFVKTKIIASN